MKRFIIAALGVLALSVDSFGQNVPPAVNGRSVVDLQLVAEYHWSGQVAEQYWQCPETYRVEVIPYDWYIDGAGETRFVLGHYDAQTIRQYDYLLSGTSLATWKQRVYPSGPDWQIEQSGLHMARVGDRRVLRVLQRHNALFAGVGYLSVYVQDENEYGGVYQYCRFETSTEPTVGWGSEKIQDPNPND